MSSGRGGEEGVGQGVRGGGKISKREVEEGGGRHTRGGECRVGGYAGYVEAYNAGNEVKGKASSCGRPSWHRIHLFPKRPQQPAFH